MVDEPTHCGFDAVGVRQPVLVDQIPVAGEVEQDARIGERLGGDGGDGSGEEASSERSALAPWSRARVRCSAASERSPSTYSLGFRCEIVDIFGLVVGNCLI